MTTSNYELHSVRPERNYSENFSFKYVTGKELWGHVNESDPSPSDSTRLLRWWKAKDARVISWILGFVDPLIVLNLRLYKTTQAIWKYLEKVYYQENNAKCFQLENNISNYSQGSLSIQDYCSFQDYYSGFQNLWAGYIDIVYAKMPIKSLFVQ
jgi:hypothetical protein